MAEVSNAFLADEGQPGAPAFWPMFHRPTVMDRMHWHGHLEIVYLSEGLLQYDLHGQHAELPAKRVALLWAFFPHRVTEVVGDGHVYVFNVPPRLFREWPLSADIRHAVLNGSMVLSSAESPYGEPMMRAWLQSEGTRNVPREALALAEVEQMVRRLDIDGWTIAPGMLSLTKRSLGEKSRPIDRIWQMLRFIDLNYMNDISVSDIARHAGLSDNYTVTVFREVMGTTLSGYLNHIRLTEAQHLLLSTRKSILTVAQEAGFGSQSRFFSVFQERFGTTPAHYRKSSAFQQRAALAKSGSQVE